MTPSDHPVVLAAVAHPDDIEFLFAGTLLLLKAAGCQVHMWNLCDGACGTMTHSREDIIRIRAEEAARSAAIAGATLHPSAFPDVGIFYDKPSLAAVAAVIRDVRPQIILTHSLQDYMEDHQNVSRLVTMGAFCRAMPNYPTAPQRPPYTDPVRIYHAPPHGLKDGIGNLFQPDRLVDIGSVIESKTRMLACHESQGAWLEGSQAMAGFTGEMQSMCRRIAGWGSGLEFAEAWRTHSHLGFCPEDFDPLAKCLGVHQHPPAT